ncbi:MAG: ribosome biogenesis GTPase [Planctomycetota bacterium]|jgi:ribosome biogenesis GTPase
MTPPAKAKLPKDTIRGRAVRVDSRMCHVDTDEGELSCRIRGNLFRLEKQFSRPIAVGDEVIIEKRSTPPHVVVEVMPRKNYLARRKAGGRTRQILAANIDQAVMVLAVANPQLNPRLLDRMLVAAEYGNFEPLIVLNKVDLLVDQADIEPIVELYRGLGYRVLMTSTKTGQGIDELRELVKDRISVLAGMSGVGKSAMLTSIQPDLALPSRLVSMATGKGRHTTTGASLIAIDVGGYVVDTPGIREFGIIDMEPWEIGHQFVEFRDLISKCRFRTCTHDHESGCAVKAAVDADEIDAYRFDSYLRILRTVQEDDKL